MAFPIIPRKRSGATGHPSSLNVGELAVNTATGELFLGGDSAVLLLNPPTAAGTTVTEHTGDGATVAFTFTGYNGTADGGYIVSVGGIDQPPSKYSISSTAGGTITFVEAPVDGELISIRAIVAGSGGGGGGTGTVTSITAGTGLEGGTITDSGTISLASITTAQSNVGSSTAIPVLSVNDQGQVTALSTTAFVALTTAQIAGLSTTAPAALSTTAIAGLSSFAARADHAHLLPSAADVGALGATAAAGGDLTGNYPNPTLAAVTTAQSNIGSSSVVPVLSVDAKGRVTSLTTAAIQAVSTTAITSLTGDVTAAGPGAAAATLAAITTAQSNVGSSTEIPVLSIDAKGRVTALSTAPAGGNATQLQGRNIAATAPSNGQFLVWNENTNQWEPNGLPYEIEVLVIAGGGGGGSGHAGGGGAGGYRTAAINLVPTNECQIVVGAGGIGGIYNSTSATAGGDSTFTTTGNNIISVGGGAGGGNNPEPANGGNGGSGGGGANAVSGSGFGGSGTSGQGLGGGIGSGGANWAAGGGGGAAEVGQNNPNTNDGGNGGNGINWLNLGTFYAGGGGGGGGLGTAGVGGLGGGGTGTIQDAGDAQSGAANTGGGGGGARDASGGNGGSGIVIVRYFGAQRGSGGTVTVAGTYTYHTFTTSGTFTA